MIQAFYTATSGLKAQQKNIDIISNNIANADTPGYRTKRVEFREILDAQTGQNTSRGYGAQISNISTMPLPNEINSLGMEISGDGFFVIQDANGVKSYTKDGDFTLNSENGTNYLVTKNNEYVLDTNGNRIELPTNTDMILVTGGQLYPNGNNGENGIKLAVVRFDSLEGLAMLGKDHYVETAQSRPPIDASNIQTVTSNYYDELAPLVMANQISELTRIVQTQMAYQFNSKSLQIADEIEGMANHLRN